MKLSIVIEGTPRINQSINYTKKGMRYKPETGMQNEKALRAGIISRLPFDFKPLIGPLRITRLRFVFPPSGVLTKEELVKISNGVPVEKMTKPDFMDCLKSLFKAMLGTVFSNEAQICSMDGVYKGCGSEPKIEIEIEEILKKETVMPVQ